MLQKSQGEGLTPQLFLSSIVWTSRAAVFSSPVWCIRPTNILNENHNLHYTVVRDRSWLTLLVPETQIGEGLETQIAEFANSIDLHEVAQYERPHLDCLPFSL